MSDIQYTFVCSSSYIQTWMFFFSFFLRVCCCCCSFMAFGRLKLFLFVCIVVFISQDNRTAAFHISLFIYANYRTNEEDACYAGVWFEWWVLSLEWLKSNWDHSKLSVSVCVCVCWLLLLLMTIFFFFPFILFSSHSEVTAIIWKCKD